MKNQISNFSIICLSVVLALLSISTISSTVSAQNACTSPVVIYPSPEPIPQLYISADSVFWIQFNTDSSKILLSLQQYSSSSAHIDNISLYSGMCTNLSLMSIHSINNNDTISFVASNLTPGSNYFFKIKRNLNYPQENLSFKFYGSITCLSNFSQVIPFAVPASCYNENLIHNWEFETGESSDITPGNTIASSFTSDYPFLATGMNTQFQITIAPDANLIHNYWQGTGFQGASTNNNFLICDGHTSGDDWTGPGYPAIWRSNTITLVPGSYVFSFQARNLGKSHLDTIYYNSPVVRMRIGTIDQHFANLPGNPVFFSVPLNGGWYQLTGQYIANVVQNINLEIYLSNIGNNGLDLGIDHIEFARIEQPIFCDLGQDITICNNDEDIITLMPEQILYGSPPYSYYWESGSNNWSTYSIQVKPEVTTTYYFTVTDAVGCTCEDEITIFVSDPLPPLLNGPRDLCNPPNQSYIYTYNIENTTGTDVYIEIPLNSGTINNGSNILSGPNISQFTVQWNISAFPPLPGYIPINVTTSNEFDCISSSILKVFACCDYYITSNTIVLIDTALTSDVTYSSTNPLTIHGTLDIFSQVIFNGTSVIMGPNARIRIHPTAHVQITNASQFMTYPECYYMWDGIYLNQRNHSIEALVIDAGSLIRDAINGVVSTNNGNFWLKGAIFEDNYIAVQISDYYNGLPGYISGSPYDCIIQQTDFRTTTNDGLLTIPPYDNQYPFAGIVVNKVNKVYFGDLNVPGSINVNQIPFGIHATNSYVVSIGNHFSNIQYPDLKNCAAIRAYNTSSPSSPLNFTPWLIVGLNTFTENKFTNCFKGVDNFNQPLDVINNIFEDCKYSIFCRQSQSPTSIIHNEILGTDPNNPLYGRGISIESTHPNSTGLLLNISLNHIQNTQEGIYLVQQSGFKEYKPLIFENLIEWNNPPVSYTLTGINIQNCDFAHVYQNHIFQNNYIPGSGDILSLRGIRISQSEQSMIESNEIINAGSGIYTNGSLLNTRFHCNTLDHCYHGFYFHVHSALSDQGQNLPGDCWVPHNKFIGPYDLNGVNNRRKMSQFFDPNADPPVGIINPTVNWTFSEINGPEYKLDENLNTNFPGHNCFEYIYGEPLSNFTIPCEEPDVPALFQNIADPAVREALFGRITRNENTYLSLDPQFNWYEKWYLYNFLVRDTSISFLGAADDARYQQIFDSLNQSDVGLVEQLYSNIFIQDYKNAIAINQTLPEFDEWVRNIKFSNEIFFETWAKGNLELNASDSAILRPIALTKPYEVGLGVYTARVLLGLDPEEFFVPYFAPAKQSTLANKTLTIYPNPAGESLFIKWNCDGIPAGQLEFFNLQGAVVYSQPISGSNNESCISLASIRPGSYYCRIKAAGHISNSCKLAIIK